MYNSTMSFTRFPLSTFFFQFPLPFCAIPKALYAKLFRPQEWNTQVQDSFKVAGWPLQASGYGIFKLIPHYFY